MEIKVGQTWSPKGYKTKWEVWYVDEADVSIFRVDIPNPGWNTPEWNKFLSREKFLKYYKR